jgi:hypothetical protein
VIAIEKSTIQPALFALAVLSASTLVASDARADEGSSRLCAQPMMYVGKFEPIERAPAGFGPLHALNADIRRIKADSNAARLSTAVTAELRKLGARADPLPADAPRRPSSGWLIKGVFYALDGKSRLISVPFVGTDKGPNVEVSVTVADFALNPDSPFAVIGTDSVLKGQGTAISWNPYVAAAKFVLHQVKGEDSIDALATQIAKKIIDERQRLLEHDASKPNEPSNR